VRGVRQRLPGPPGLLALLLSRSRINRDTCRKFSEHFEGNPHPGPLPEGEGGFAAGYCLGAIDTFTPSCHVLCSSV
jgi:hypothetical protein